MRTQTGLARADVIQRMVDTFAGLHRLSPGQIGEATLARAQPRPTRSSRQPSGRRSCPERGRLGLAPFYLEVPVYASHVHAPRRGWRPVLAAALGLAGCGSSPPANITLAAPAATSSTPEKVGDLATERIKWASNKPDCKGDCPRIEIDSVAFPAYPS